MSEDIKYKFDFHLEMNPEKPGHYKVEKCFEQDKHIFPAGGRLDKSCAMRLLEARTGKPVALQPVSSPPPSSGDTAQQAPVPDHRKEVVPLWRKDDGVYQSTTADLTDDHFRSHLYTVCVLT